MISLHIENNNIQSLYSDISADRSDWRRNVLEKNAQINNLCERIYPLDRGVVFGKQFAPGKNDVKQTLDRKAVIELILHHLSTKGLKQTRQTLEKESKVTTPTTDQLNESRLVTFVRNALRDTDRIYDFSIDHAEYSAEERQVKSNERDDLLYSMDLLEDEYEDDGVNIWDEPPENIVVETTRNAEDDQDEEVVKWGTLNKLVETLTHGSKVDQQFLKTFMMTYQSFCSPEKLLGKLEQRYNVPKFIKSSGGADAGTSEEGAIKAIQLKVINVLKKWLDEYFSDFDDKLIQSLRNFIEVITLKHPGPAAALMKSLTKVEKQPASKLKFNDKTPEPIVPRNIFSQNLSIYDIDEEEIARQMTLIEFEIYKRIKPPELLNQSWNKVKLKHRAPNVLKMIDRFNNVSMWVATMIIETPKVKARARMMTRFIKIADHLRLMNNFNSLMAIIAGLNFSSVYRLKFTRAELSAQTQRMYDDLEKIMNSESSFKNYRTRLAASRPPLLPYLGVHLTDLTFMEENPDIVNIEVAPNHHVDLINFTKRMLVFKVISLVQQYQQQSYNLQPVHQIQEFLLSINDYKGESLDHYQQHLHRESLRREPRKAQKSDIA
ncbi:hypothetical protein SAMD00019534_059530 [Acytostelium subglobosum LB1]|uniref:hypothetical protein n=1 Tax=Acytostelium subglobosum LB1 TaxID=1410327 RepID=UPI000644B183|nr:hypothetical protein SAMD00019534_059530 [Acytostelium subglobosum LB1]GAM22778.1 hypothetical protein SAMD00019534_059530 [Acytostelium subglobosum LB1]|eukprot:XP_012754005.1 hypothetical protein SAMD00019534_059530 [Acytostelium subglobosum LB1]